MSRSTLVLLSIVWVICMPDVKSFRTSLHEPHKENSVHLNYNLNVYCLQNLPVADESDTSYNPQDEKKVLEDIYYNTGGPYWTNRTGWLDPNVHHCLWYGVTCDNNTHYVISLDLNRNNLVNSLPSSLWKLRKLLALCASTNSKLAGELKTFVFPNMTRLIRIDLSFCALTGSIPDSITNLTSLVKIQLCCQKGTGLTGSIPSGIGNLTELQVLSIGENAIRGQIPSGISNLAKLWFLDFEILRKLKGSIDLFYNLSSLEFLHVSNCGLSGSISQDFGKFFPKMNQCLLPKTNLQGNVPKSVNYMQNLTQLVLSHNHLKGVIPRTIGDIPSLRIVDLSSNQLNGFENGTTFEKSKIEILIISGNRDLSADFSEFVNSMTSLKNSLRIMNVSSCHFTGKIPDILWTFPNLISIDIGYNKIHSEIPEVPYDMIFLLRVDFSWNNLSGHIPASFSQLHVLQELDISKNPAMKSLLHDKRDLQNFLEPDLSILIKPNPSDKLSCPRLRFSFNHGIVIVDPSYYAYSYCVCDIGYYGYQDKCQKCMQGGTCDDRDSSADVVYPSVMSVTKGFWPFPSPDNVTHLAKCNAVPHQVESSCNPNGSVRCNLESMNGSLFTRCHSSLVCQEGSYGRFCSRCMINYYRSGNMCFKCPHFSVNMSFFIVMFAVSLVVLWWAFVYVRKRTRSLALLVAFGQVVGLGILWCIDLIPGWLFEINTLLLLLYVAGRGRKTRGLAKIVIFYLQIFDAMISGFNAWPLEVIKAQHYISSIVNFHFSSMACQYPSLFTPLGRLSVVLLVPVIGITLVWMYYGVMYVWYQRSTPVKRNVIKRVQRLKWECRQTSIVILNMIYFPIVKQTIAMIVPCTEDSGVSYLPTVPWLNCTSSNSTYVTLRAIAGLAIALYVVGIPFGVFGPLLAKYSNLRKAFAKNEGNRLVLIEKQANMDMWLGSIYLPYKENVRSKFEIFALLRKFSIACTITLISSQFLISIMTLVVILFACIVVQLLLKPYIDSFDTFPLENFCEALVLGVLLHSFVLIPFAEMAKGIEKAAILWLVIAINAVTIVTLIVSVIAIFCKKRQVSGNSVEETSQTSEISHRSN